MQAYTEALRRTVTGESVVLDLGAGLGAFAVYACKLGARRVFAVEPNEVIDVARVVARDNGCDGRIDFFQANSGDVTLPERATVIVSDLRGSMPGGGYSLQAGSSFRRATRCTRRSWRHPSSKMASRGRRSQTRPEWT